MTGFAGLSLNQATVQKLEPNSIRLFTELGSKFVPVRVKPAPEPATAGEKPVMVGAATAAVCVKVPA